MQMDLNFIAFLVMGLAATILSGVMVTRRWPVSAAMLLIAVMTLLAGMFGLLEAHFAAVAQIIVYAGAIMVVFVFVMMLLNLPPEELRYGGVTWGEMVLIGLGVLVALVLGTQVGQGLLTQGLESMGYAVGQTPTHARALYFPASENVKNVAATMFVDYLWAFELVSFLILAAVIGSIVIAKKRSADNANAA
jgi:NADH-quinone oxidoreductase subunit J